MSFGPSVQRFKAMYDGAHDDAAALMTEARAGLWLTLLATELGLLPTRQGEWGLITVLRAGTDAMLLDGQDTEAIKLYTAAAIGGTSTSNALDSYQQYICAAVLICIRHTQDAR